jgi:hypothetical protein
MPVFGMKRTTVSAWAWPAMAIVAKLIAVSADIVCMMMVPFQLMLIHGRQRSGCRACSGKRSPSVGSDCDFECVGRTLPHLG